MRASELAALQGCRGTLVENRKSDAELTIGTCSMTYSWGAPTRRPPPLRVTRMESREWSGKPRSFRLRSDETIIVKGQGTIFLAGPC